MDEIDLEAMKEGFAIKKLKDYTCKRHEKRKPEKRKPEKEIDILRILNIFQ